MHQIEVGAADLDIEHGGSGWLDIGTDLLGGSAIFHAVRVRDIGPDAVHEEGVGQIPPQGGPQADGAANEEEVGRGIGLPPTGGCNGGGRFTGGGDLRLPPTEHSHTIYCDYTYCVTMSGGEAEAGGKGGNAMVVTRGFGFVGDADSRPGGGADRGVGEDGWDGDCNRQLVNWGGYCSNHNLKEIY